MEGCVTSVPLAIFVMHAIQGEVVGNKNSRYEILPRKYWKFSWENVIQQSEMCTPLLTATCTGALKTR